MKQYVIKNYDDKVMTTYMSDYERNEEEVMEEQGVWYDEDEYYYSEEVYQCDRDKNEVVRVKDLMEAFERRYGHDESGCSLSYGSDIWFSPSEILEFIGKFADEHGMI